MFNNYYQASNQLGRQVNYAAQPMQPGQPMVNGFNRLQHAFPGASNSAAQVVAASVASVNAAAAAATFTTLQLMGYGDGSGYSDPTSTLSMDLLAAAAQQQQQQQQAQQSQMQPPSAHQHHAHSHHIPASHTVSNPHQMMTNGYGSSANGGSYNGASFAGTSTSSTNSSTASSSASSSTGPGRGRGKRQTPAAARKTPRVSRASLESDMFRKLVHEHVCRDCGGKFGDKAGVVVHHPCFFKQKDELDNPSNSSNNPLTAAQQLQQQLLLQQQQLLQQTQQQQQQLQNPNQKGKEKKREKGPGGPYLCTYELCGKAFNLLYALRRHMLFHLDEMHYDCLSCGHQTKAKSDMVKHVRVHKDIKPFQCSYCPKQFSDPSALANHVRTHTGKASNRSAATGSGARNLSVPAPNYVPIGGAYTERKSTFYAP